MKKYIFVIFISTLFASIGQVGADLYLPSLPAISISLNTTAHMAQATVFLFMIGYAAARLIYGPISDAVGRKKPLIVGLLCYLLGVVVCAMAPSIAILILGRFLQGLGAGAGVVIASAIIRDMLEGEHLAQAYSYMSLANIVFIASAPLAGGYLQHAYGWRSSFIVLIVFAAIALCFGLFVLRETNIHRTLQNLKPKQLKTNFLTLFANKQFIIYGLFIFIAYGGIVAWLTLGPILLHFTLGFSPVGFGWVALLGGAFYAVGVIINTIIGKKAGINKMLFLGTICITIASIFLLLFALLHMLNFWVIIMPVMLFFTSAGFIFPNAYAGALTPFGKIAGIAGAVIGCMQIVGGTVASGIMTLSPVDTQMPLAIVFMALSVLAIFVSVMLIKRPSSLSHTAA